MMADYGAVQISLKAGTDLLNVAGDNVDELRNRLDELFGEGAAQDFLGRFLVTAVLVETTTPVTGGTIATGSTVVSTGGNNTPTDKQIKFAKTLGIQNADKLTRRELSAEIDRRKA